MSRKPTPEELWKKMLEPFEPDEIGFDLEVDHELERTLAMTPAEIRADLAAMGYDVPALERQARAFLGLDRKRKRLGLVALVGAPLATVATLAEAFAPSIPPLLPMVAQAPEDVPAITAAAAPAPAQALDHNDKDGGSR